MEVSKRIRLGELRAHFLAQINKLGEQVYVLPDGEIKNQLEQERNELIRAMREA